MQDTELVMELFGLMMSTVWVLKLQLSNVQRVIGVNITANILKMLVFIVIWVCIIFSYILVAFIVFLPFLSLSFIGSFLLSIYNIYIYIYIYISFFYILLSFIVFLPFFLSFLYFFLFSSIVFFSEYIYIYIYMCVCVCVCVMFFKNIDTNLYKNNPYNTEYESIYR